MQARLELRCITPEHCYAIQTSVCVKGAPIFNFICVTQRWLMAGTAHLPMQPGEGSVTSSVNRSCGLVGWEWVALCGETWDLQGWPAGSCPLLLAVGRPLKALDIKTLTPTPTPPSGVLPTLSFWGEEPGRAGDSTVPRGGWAPSGVGPALCKQDQEGGMTSAPVTSAGSLTLDSSLPSLLPGSTLQWDQPRVPAAAPPSPALAVVPTLGLPLSLPSPPSKVTCQKSSTVTSSQTWDGPAESPRPGRAEPEPPCSPRLPSGAPCAGDQRVPPACEMGSRPLPPPVRSVPAPCGGQPQSLDGFVSYSPADPLFRGPVFPNVPGVEAVGGSTECGRNISPILSGSGQPGICARPSGEEGKAQGLEKLRLEDRL